MNCSLRPLLVKKKINDFEGRCDASSSLVKITVSPVLFWLAVVLVKVL